MFFVNMCPDLFLASLRFFIAIHIFISKPVSPFLMQDFMCPIHFVQHCLHILLLINKIICAHSCVLCHLSDITLCSICCWWTFLLTNSLVIIMNILPSRVSMGHIGFASYMLLALLNSCHDFTYLKTIDS